MSTEGRTYDVAVSGGGPAGALAARSCARRGLRTLLIERSDGERSKCCGGGLLERTIRSLNVPLIADVVEREVRGCIIVCGEEKHEFRERERLGVVVRRQRFDTYLWNRAEDAGADTLRAEVRNVENGSGGVRIGTTEGDLRAKVMIIAEGCTSRSATQVFGPYPPEDRAMGMMSECTFAEDFPDVYEFDILNNSRPRVQFEYPGAVNGWAFPLSEGANVGVGWLRCDTAEVKFALDKLVERIGRECGGVKYKAAYRAHPIPVRPREQVRKGRCLLVGDAAGLASPISGEGMSYAVSSANLAAEAVGAMFDNDERPGSLRSYERALGREVKFTLKAARAISMSLIRLMDPLDIGLFFDNFGARSSLRRGLVGFARGESSWKPLFCRSVLSMPWLFFSSLAVHKLDEAERSVHHAQGSDDQDCPRSSGAVEPVGGHGAHCRED